ncbi:small nucleolar ribonucleoprotein complex component [Niveomyces insectorum RCEF 264]|uniref:Small nucleolar ribonucleoprotein complex component n=1 Tax=Niveomyces insectorum RCEF 264 TaxID=1081102 RepID=A0A167P0S6_9HYPO|nr:small nucleolar ribonucleoprotein complex component [Niveomyces insectorum RCEF 264]
MSSTKRKAAPVRVAKPVTTRIAKPTLKPVVNEAKATVTGVPQTTTARGPVQQDAEAIEISSDSENSEDAVDAMDEDNEEESTAAPIQKHKQTKANGQPTATNAKLVPKPAANGTANGDEEDETASIKKDGNDEDDADTDTDEPTFGDLVREQHETVDVAAAFGLLPPNGGTATGTDDTLANGAGEYNQVAVKAGAKALAPPPTLASLGHLLNAALRSGDDANLEICFNTTTDASWVRNTIQRLDPALAGTLLQKLAARIHRRPGRAHTLIGWVQWTLIAHGGALLASQPGVTRALQSLHRVLEERARGLNSLLLLKGKLDMLEAQMQLRRLQRAGAGPNRNAAASFSSAAARVPGRLAGAGTGRTGANRRRNGRGQTNGAGSVDGGASDEDLEEVGITTYVEGDDDEAEEDKANAYEAGTGHIPVNGGLSSSNAMRDAVVDFEDETQLNGGGDDDDSEDDEDEYEGSGDEAQEVVEEMDEDGVVDEDEIDFDDVDDDEEDDDEDEEDNEDPTAAAQPPAKVQKKSGGAFSKRR